MKQPFFLQWQSHRAGGRSRRIWTAWLQCLALPTNEASLIHSKTACLPVKSASVCEDHQKECCSPEKTKTKTKTTRQEERAILCRSNSNKEKQVKVSLNCHTLLCAVRTEKEEHCGGGEGNQPMAGGKDGGWGGAKTPTAEPFSADTLQTFIASISLGTTILMASLMGM